MSHALLLRLFLSPSFFSVHVALQYLVLYSDHVGITYYLTRRLRELDPHELRDSWGFICHLLITRPSKSRALECFVTEMSEQSTHLAMFTLWFMQAYLKDLALSRSTSASFTICQRVLHNCHEIIFGDLASINSSPYSTLKISCKTRFARTKIKRHLEPCVVGIGCILAGAPGLPSLANIVGPVAVEQGRLDDETQPIRSVDFGVRDHVSDSTSPTNESPEEELSEDDEPPDSQTKVLDAEEDAKSRKASVHSRRQTASGAQTTPALPLPYREVRKSIASRDPFGQLDTHTTVSGPYQSSPAVSTVKQHKGVASSSTIDAILAQYDAHSLRLLLQSHYCRSEIQLVLSLDNISHRLLVVPKPARVSALRAELTSLNHQLPAEVCLPMWCDCSDLHDSSYGRPKAHHRIVRIPPGESVVLNSAEHAPYLLLVEILNGDLDFVPAKRGNKEVLKRIVSKGYDPSASHGPRNRMTDSSQRNIEGGFTVAAFHTQSNNQCLSDSPLVIPNQVVANEDEEIDLVEQLYGSDLSIHHTPDLSEFLVLPPVPENKALDAVAWTRSASHPASPATTPTVSSSQNPSETRRVDASVETMAATTDRPILSLDEYSDRMRTAAVMLAQLNANLVKEVVIPSTRPPAAGSGETSLFTRPAWLPSSNQSTAVAGTDQSPGPIHPSLSGSLPDATGGNQPSSRMKLQHSEAAAIRDRIMQEMLSLEEERMKRMQETSATQGLMSFGAARGNLKTAEDETIIRRELNKVDPSAVIFQESWAAKKSRIRQGSPYGHLASWDCTSVIVKTGGDLRQEQLAVQLIREFERIWQEENCGCWVRYFRILITGGSSGLVETITDAVSIHSIKKAEYARRLAEGRLGHVTLLDHFVNTYGDPSSAKFTRARRNFAKSLAGYSIVTYLLQIKDRHNGNILLDRDGHLIHIDFGFMLSNSPGNIGFEAAPFKLPFEYIEVLGGLESEAYLEFRTLFRQGFEAARKHCDRIITIIELMQKDSHLPCFAALGAQTAQQLRERFQPALTQSSAGDYIERLIMSSLGSNWTRLYDSYQYYAQSIL
ncbi:kinase-like protein [Rickenella mellea]|uniref:1-phosphatidylinositol 4-kinase n=1 Tax=Rickenella mellea TaxID=50990 RepID=A0A4Y7QJT3_9AGAM|nr:kinase-like protein [Rickenella mellea]